MLIHREPWKYSGRTPEFFTGQAGCYCCGGPTETTVVWFYGVKTGAVPIRDTDSYVEDAWTAKTDGPTPARSLCSAASIDANAYVWGGTFTSSPFYLTENQQFIHSTDTWTTKASMPAHRNEGVGVGLAAKAYSMCGSDSSFVPTRTTYQYTASSDSWATKTDAPTPLRKQCRAFAIGDYGYLCGGVNDLSAILNDNDQYDASGDSWTAKTNMSAARTAGAGFVQEGTGVYATGNKGSGVLETGTDLYDASANSWSAGPTFGYSFSRVPRYLTTGGTAGGAAKGFVASGLSAAFPGETDNNDKLDLTVPEWTAGTAMPAPKRWSSVCTGAS